MRLTDVFDIAASAPDGANKLRALVLKLAMGGRLVHQNPDEPDAMELLKAIEREKERSKKANSIRSQPFEPFAPDDEPFPAPAGWIWARLGTIGNIFNGNSINAAEKDARFTRVKGRPYIATKDVGYGLDLLDYDNGIQIPHSESKFRTAHSGAVLMCAEGGSAGKKCGITDRDICFGNKLFAIELYGGIPSRFLLYFYLSELFRKSFEGAMTGIIGGVSIAKFVEIPVPIPPLPEQVRIVAKIDQLMSLCAELERAKADRDATQIAMHSSILSKLLGEEGEAAFAGNVDLLDSHFSDLYGASENVEALKNGILQLAVMGKLSEARPGDDSAADVLAKAHSERRKLRLKDTSGKISEASPLGYTIPDTWRWARLDDILVYGPTNGFSPKAVDFKTDVKSLTLSATTSGVFKGEHSKYIDINIPIESDLWLRDGDILVQRGNTLEYVGVPAIYRGRDGEFIYPDLMMKLRLSAAVDTDYVYYAMSSEPSRRYLRERASGTSGTMPKINQGTLRSLPIPIPPLAEQRRIVAAIKELAQKCELLIDAIDLAQRKQTELTDAALAQV